MVIGLEMFIVFSKKAFWEGNDPQWAPKSPAAWNLYESAKYESWRCGCQTSLSCVAKRAPSTGTAWAAHRGGVEVFGMAVQYGTADMTRCCSPLLAACLGGLRFYFMLPPISTVSLWFMQPSASTSSALSTAGELWVCWQKPVLLHLLLWVKSKPLLRGKKGKKKIKLLKRKIEFK